METVRISLMEVALFKPGGHTTMFGVQVGEGEVQLNSPPEGEADKVMPATFPEQMDFE